MTGGGCERDPDGFACRSGLFGGESSRSRGWRFGSQGPVLRRQLRRWDTARARVRRALPRGSRTRWRGRGRRVHRRVRPLVHQIPVGISLAAVLIAARVGRAGVMRVAVLLGLVIPAAAALTVAFPTPGEGTLGLLTGVAGGVLAYIGAAHLLPEAQAEDTNRSAGIMFVATFVITAAGLIALPHFG